MIRRTKKDLLDLPQQTKLILTITMQEQQQQLYRLIKNGNHSNRATDCAKIACHPKLVDPAMPLFGSSGMHFFSNLSFFWFQFRFVGVLGKFDVAINLLERIVMVKKEKVVIFCIYKDLIDLMREALTEKNIKHLLLTGDCSASERQMNIKLFQDDDLWIKCQVMICTYPVGGQGVTLTAANHVMLFTPPTSDAIATQAIDRYVFLLRNVFCFWNVLSVIRVGQSKPVTIYQLVASGSREEKRIIANERKSRISHFMVREKCFLESEVNKKLKSKPIPASFNFAISCNEDITDILNVGRHDSKEYDKFFAQTLKGIMPKPQPPKPQTPPRSPPTLPQSTLRNSRQSPSAPQTSRQSTPARATSHQPRSQGMFKTQFLSKTFFFGLWCACAKTFLFDKILRFWSEKHF